MRLSYLRRDSLSEESAALGLETDTVAFDRIGDGRAEPVLPSVERFDEILDQPEVGSGVEGLSEKSRKVVCLLFAASEFADAERSSPSISPYVIRMWVSRWSPSVKASIEREIVMSFSQQPDFICPAFSWIVSRCSRRRRF